MARCIEPDCDRTAHVAGLCRYHYGVKWREAHPGYAQRYREAHVEEFREYRRRYKQRQRQEQA